MDEEPADVSVEEPLDLVPGSLFKPDVRAVRIALLIGEGMVLSVVGDPGDDRARDRGPVLKDRWVKRRWKPTVIPNPVGMYRSAKTSRSLQRSQLPASCQATKPSIRNGMTVSAPVMIRSRVS
jgi:hypothetical protein